MLPFIRKKKSGGPENEKNSVPPEPPPSEQVKPPGREVPPGVQYLKEIWQIGTVKKKKEMPPPGVPTDIYCVPKQRQMPPRHGSQTG